MIRNALLYLSNQPRVFKFVKTNRLAKGFASRFVAGETLETAVPAVRELNRRGITASLDLLGESVHNEAEARAAGAEYLKILDRIAREKLDANVSVKLTAMGLDVSEDLCISIMHDVLERARKYDSFVRLDMEASGYTQKTLELFENRLYPEFRGTVGVVLQAYLYRTQADVEHMNTLGARVRICKGAYKEPAAVAFPEKHDVDVNYVKCMQELVLDGNYPGIATHDEKIIEQAKAFARENHIKPEQFEFQMLYGVRRDLQEKIVNEGWRMRCYVPFGTQWYPYLMRRLAERPANVAFMTGNIIKEMVRGRG
jgi:proline dehydrogenase